MRLHDRRIAGADDREEELPGVAEALVEHRAGKMQRPRRIMRPERQNLRGNDRLPLDRVGIDRRLLRMDRPARHESEHCSRRQELVHGQASDATGKGHIRAPFSSAHHHISYEQTPHWFDPITSL